MKIRSSQLAGQWYPGSANSITGLINSWSDYINQEPMPSSRAVSLIAPHAGWVYSGKLAARALARAAFSYQAYPPDLVIVLGGHLGPSDPLIIFEESGWSTPLGPLDLDSSLNELVASFNPVTWAGPTNDNTIEVMLPLIKHYFPNVKLWPFRVPPTLAAARLGEVLFDFLKDRPKPALVVASTDLTHYGQAYGFAPAGSGQSGEDFRLQNDRSFIEAALALDIGQMLVTGHVNRAACSVGAAMVAARLATLNRAVAREVDSYASSDVMPGPQSVGYAGLEFVLGALDQV
jgi:AmmeMemoRadiSam system protein B